MISCVISLFFVYPFIFCDKVSGTIPLIISIKVSWESLAEMSKIEFILINEERSRLMFAWSYSNLINSFWLLIIICDIRFLLFMHVKTWTKVSLWFLHIGQLQSLYKSYRLNFMCSIVGISSVRNFMR